MITAQDIRERTFEKARFNGYDMADVDDFLLRNGRGIKNPIKQYIQKKEFMQKKKRTFYKILF